MKSLCKYSKYLWWNWKLLQTRSSIQYDEVTSVTHIEALERHFFEEDICDNSD